MFQFNLKNSFRDVSTSGLSYTRVTRFIDSYQLSVRIKLSSRLINSFLIVALTKYVFPATCILMNLKLLCQLKFPAIMFTQIKKLEIVPGSMQNSIKDKLNSADGITVISLSRWSHLSFDPRPDNL